MEEKIFDWVKAIENLAETAVRLPQSVCAGMQHVFQQELTLIQRVVSNIGDLSSRLKSAIKANFSQKYWRLYVSIKQGETTIPKQEVIVEFNNYSSTCECSHFIDPLKVRKIFDAIYHKEKIKEIKGRMKIEKAENLRNI